MSKEKERLAAIANQNLDALWQNANDYGLWIRKGEVSTIADYKRSRAQDWFKRLVSESRRTELKRGSKPTDEEIAAFQEPWAGEQFEQDEANSIPGYALATVEDGVLTGTALILRTGYSFSEISTWLEGFSVLI